MNLGYVLFLIYRPAYILGFTFRIRQENEGDREAILAALVCRTFRDHTMVFVTTKRQAHRVRLLLGLLGVKVIS